MCDVNMNHHGELPRLQRGRLSRFGGTGYDHYIKIIYRWKYFVLYL